MRLLIGEIKLTLAINISPCCGSFSPPNAQNLKAGAACAFWGGRPRGRAAALALDSKRIATESPNALQGTYTDKSLEILSRYVSVFPLPTSGRPTKSWPKLGGSRTSFSTGHKAKNGLLAEFPFTTGRRSSDAQSYLRASDRNWMTAIDFSLCVPNPPSVLPILRPVFPSFR